MTEINPTAKLTPRIAHIFRKPLNEFFQIECDEYVENLPEEDIPYGSYPNNLATITELLSKLEEAPVDQDVEISAFELGLLFSLGQLFCTMNSGDEDHEVQEQVEDIWDWMKEVDSKLG